MLPYAPTRRLTAVLLPLPCCVILALGCGSTSSSSEASDAATAGGEVVSAAAGSAQAAAIPVIAAPTAEQIARWTPAPFEPLELLAIREWKKTSFTSRVAATPDGKHVLVVGSRVLLWSLTGDEPEHIFLELTSADGDRDLLALAVAPSGKWFAVGDSNGFVRVWSLDDRQELFNKQLNDNAVTALAISPDSREIATIAYDSKVDVWSADALAPLKSFEIDTNGIKSIEYVAPGLLAVAGETTTLWNTATGMQERELSPGRYSFALARSTDGAKFLYGGDDKLTLWDVAASKVDAEITHGVTGSELVAFSPDGKLLATSNGRGVELWSLAEGRVVQVIDGFGWAVVGLSWLPETNLLAVASESGVTRIWGTPAQGAAVGLKPLHAPVALPATDSRDPAFPAQMEQLIDFRTFPTIPGSKPSIVDLGDYSGDVPVSIDEAKTFYNHFLTQQGWTSLPMAPPNTGVDYRKDGFLINASFYESSPGTTNVSLHHEGNYDARWAPKFDGAPIETRYETAGTLSYGTKANLLDIETALLRKMHAAGWAAYSRLHTSHSEEPDARDLEFVRNGMTLRVSIGKFPIDPAGYTITYTPFSVNSSAPIPPDAGYVEFDGSTEPALVAITKMTLDQARQFYNDQLTAQGWLIRSRGESDKKERQWITAIRNQSDVAVGFTKLPDGRTLVRIGDTGGSLFEASPLAQDPDEADAEEEPIATGAEPIAAGLEAADLPILNETKAAKYDAINHTIEVVIPSSTLAAAAERYTAALAELGWQAMEGGMRDEQYTLIDFTKGDEEFTLRARKQQGAAVVDFEGDGLLWTKELPGGKQVISYETWLRLGKHPASLELLDQYEAEMRALTATNAAAAASQ